MKIIKIVSSVVLLFLVLLIAFYLVVFSSPKITIKNETSWDANVKVSWRDETKIIDGLKPGDSFSFSINEEASVFFDAKLENKQEISSASDIYVTPGIRVNAVIGSSSIEVSSEI